MDNGTPKNGQEPIIGNRQLTAQETHLVNHVKAIARSVGELVGELREYDEADQRWISIGKTDLQAGFMALTRAITKPTTF